MSVFLTLNAGGSSVKFAIFANEPGQPRLLHGRVENIGPRARMLLRPEAGAEELRELGQTDQHRAVIQIEAALAPYLEGREVVAVGHRIVHGGPKIDGPRRLHDALIDELDSYSPLAPLHQHNNMNAVRAAQAAFPKALQLGVFDTAFHRGHPKMYDIFALPKKYYEQGIHRYGFHGLSYDFIRSELRREAPDLLAGKVLVAHLGNGASICAMENGRSISCTMGFSPLEGLPMATRSGQIDPGVLLYLLQHEGLSPEELTRVLYRESGLKGISGETGDMRELLASDSQSARDALEYYCVRLAREIGAMSAVLGGLDALVFTGGVGENAPWIRANALAKLGFLGLELDPNRNEANASRIESGRVPVLVVPTNEERVIVRALAAEMAAA